MIPYQGNKKKIAHEILNQIPSANNFYDLFGGGGAVTKAASELDKWKTIHYNEINCGVYLLFKELIEGKFDFEKARNTWISREEFHRLKNEPSAWGGYVATCWSFGNGLEDYLYGRDKELAKLLMFVLVNYENVFLPNTNQNERRLFLQRAVKSLVKVGGKELESLQKQQALQNLESLVRLQSIEAIIEPTKLTSVIATNMDYRQVKIARNSVVYCDIPYSGGEGTDPRSYCIKFNRPDFLDWAATRNFPVYISEYEITDPRFKCLWKKNIRCVFSSTSNTTPKTERLYWNRV